MAFFAILFLSFSLLIAAKDDTFVDAADEVDEDEDDPQTDAADEEES